MSRQGDAFGSLLRRFRSRAELTQEELAERAGVSAKAVGALERGERAQPRPRTLRRLARALALSASEHQQLLDLASAGQRREEPDGGSATAPLETLPVEELPRPGPLPSGSRMPFARSPLFTGRASLLRAVAAAFRSGAWSAVLGQVIAATGLGGVGKTHLAVEFVHRYGRFFPGGVYWLSFASPDEIPLEVAACGGPGFLALGQDFATLPVDAQVALVRSAWEHPVPRLLVFDNCEDESLLAQWRPASGGGRVLVTSRRSRWDPALGVERLEVDVMPRQESVDLLRRFRSDIDDAGLGAIAEEIGHLPLALHLAGSFLHRYRAEIGPEAYLAQLREPGMIAHASLLGRGLTARTSPTGHVQSVAQTFAMSYGRLDAEDDVDRTALALLARAARFAPGEPVPRELLQSTLGEPANLEGRLHRSDALERLAALGLVASSGDRIRLHRLLAYFVASLEPDASAQPDVDEALVVAGQRAAERSLTLPALLNVIAQLRHVITSSTGDADLRAARLSGALGLALQGAGDLASGLPALEHALAIRERLLGHDHPDTAASRTDLAGLLADRGRLEAARGLLVDALAVRERALGGEHPATAATVHQLARVLRDQGELQMARRHFERAVEVRGRTLGESDARTAESISELAFLLKEQGELAAARPLFARALAILERTLGPDHPATATSLNDLGLLLRDLGELDEGRVLLDRAVAIRSRALGPTHPETASSLNNLAALLRAGGDSAGALDLFRQALEIREQVLGPDHPHTAQSINNVAGPLQDRGELDAARVLFERALAIRERVLGPDHPDTGASLNNLACLLRDQGEFHAARPLQVRAVEVFRNGLGPDHPTTGRAVHNLALIRQGEGARDEARRLFEQALTIRELALGPAHPDVAATLDGLGALLLNQSDPSGAALLERALAIRLRALGPEHPQTRQSQERMMALRSDATRGATGSTGDHSAPSENVRPS